ncbi:hypothetical protein ABE042_10390 [Viridibacillus arvi]|uniref:hypothetical protein n=1 Tax=Viridibacillus arvi TaxID=263475 RepID=UPI003D2CD4D6
MEKKQTYNKTIVICLFLTIPQYVLFRAYERAELLIVAAECNPFQSTLSQSLLISLNMYIDLLQTYRQQLSTLECEIDQLAAQLEEYKLIKSLSCVGF